MSDILSLDGRDYFISDKVNYKNKEYLYVVACDNTYDFSILEVSNENGETYYESVSDSSIISDILFYISNKQEKE